MIQFYAMWPLSQMAGETVDTDETAQIYFLETA